MLDYKKIKDYYDGGYWDEYRVAMAVKCGKITIAEYTEITGEPYTA